MILKEEISEEAVKYIKAVKDFGGELSYGNKEHEELINTKQTLVDGYWHNKKSEWHEPKSHAWDLGLVEGVEVGDGCYFRVRISKKGERVLEQIK